MPDMNTNDLGKDTNMEETLKVIIHVVNNGGVDKKSCNGRVLCKFKHNRDQINISRQEEKT